MCNRYCLREPANLQGRIAIENHRGYLMPRYNLGPLDIVPAIFDETPGSLSIAQRGIPTELGDHRMDSAVAFMVAKEELQKYDWALHRCVLPADGYYEWPHDLANDFPELFSVRDERLFMLAAVWTWLPRMHADCSDNACVLVMTEPNRFVAPTHPSMPAILRQEHVAAWLSPETPLTELAEMLAPYPAEAMHRRPVACRLDRN